ncbi:cytochrome P450 [Streptomyces olivaceoviridis]|uniref:cytochrome P450 n=1 Tax=Streptomyces olivaceoviridis TaxID=1921 RepID=UPI00167257DD|nr:cytochrome P450 [Streptomyces olivaceoviridis]GGZ20595.1 cytochrome P450 [Streptomyces olivaceoviridis]
MAAPITYQQLVDRTDHFAPPTVLTAAAPLSRMRYPDGHVGWLATGLEVAKEVLSSPAFSHNFHSAHFPMLKKGEPFPSMPIIPGMFIHMDPPEHTRYRGMLTAEFGTGRMAELAPRIKEIAAGQLDELRAQGSPADLLTAYIRPLVLRVLSEVVGVPYEDTPVLAALADTANDDDVPLEDEFAAEKRAFFLTRDLVERARTSPGNDILGRLTAVEGLSDREITNMLLVVFVAGFATCEGAVAAAALALLHHGDQLATFRAAAASGRGTESAVEELLRYTTVNQYQIFRTALEDVRLRGELVRKGDTVTVSLPAANRDPARFGCPAHLDLAREDAAGHIAFGYGPHACVGRRLGRAVLGIALETLVLGLPEPALDEPLEDIPLRARTPVLSVQRLPVRW